MADPALLALLHAEIDAELDAHQRADLARRLLVDAQARDLRDDLQRLCTALDTMPDEEPPPQLAAGVLAALPRAWRPVGPRWSAPRWRLAAMIAGVLLAGAVVFEVVRGPQPATTDAAGTLTAPPAILTVDTARIENGELSGRVSLYRDRQGLGLKFELTAGARVDALIAGGGHTLRVENVGRGAAGTTAVALTGFGVAGEALAVSFLMGDRQVGGVTLRAPQDR